MHCDQTWDSVYCEFNSGGTDGVCFTTSTRVCLLSFPFNFRCESSYPPHFCSIYAPSDIPLVSSAHQSQTVVQPDPVTSSCLGIVPHQIRGYLAQFNNLKITGQAYDRCTGCSDIVRFASITTHHNVFVAPSDFFLFLGGAGTTGYQSL